MMRTRIIGCAALSLSSACGGDARELGVDSGVVVETAADGSRLVHNVGPAWAPGEEWRIADSPSLTLPTEPSVYFGRVLTAVRLTDGRIWVADPLLRQILVFDAAGSLAGTLGGRGDGPGEFVSLNGLQKLTADTVLAWDTNTSRVTTYHRGMRLVKTSPVDRLPSNEGWIGSPDRARFVKQVDRGSAVAPVGLHRAPRYVVRTNDHGLDTVGVWPGREGMYVSELTPIRSLFSPDSHLAGGGAPWRLAIGDGAKPLFEVRDSAGALLHTVTWPSQAEPLTVSRIRARRDWLIDYRVATELAPDRQASSNQIDQLPEPTADTEFESLLIDDLGYVWVGKSPTTVTRGEPWSALVFDPDGRWLGTVTMPDLSLPLAIDRDVIIALHQDDLGVHTVRVYDLDRRTPR